MKKLLLLLGALLMLTSCDFLGMFKEEAKDNTPAYVGTWESTVTDVDDEMGITTTSTITLELTETTFSRTDVGILSGDSEDMIDFILALSGGDIDTNTLTIALRGTLAVEGATVSITPTHIKMGVMDEVAATDEDAEVMAYTWSVEGDQLTLTAGDDVEVYTKK